tara:strand:- start:6 stop:245 length:240 start_codon:yes stop_codon:yes gene_type:complete
LVVEVDEDQKVRLAIAIQMDLEMEDLVVVVLEDLVATPAPLVPLEFMELAEVVAVHQVIKHLVLLVEQVLLFLNTLNHN